MEDICGGGLWPAVVITVSSYTEDKLPYYPVLIHLLGSVGFLHNLLE